MQVVGLEEIQDDNRKKKCMCVAHWPLRIPKLVMVVTDVI